MDLIAGTAALIDVCYFRNKHQRIQDLVEKAGQSSLVGPWIVQAEFKRGFAPINLPRANFGLSCEYPDHWIAAHALTRSSPHYESQAF